MHLKLSSVKWWQFCLDLNVLNMNLLYIIATFIIVIDMNDIKHGWKYKEFELELLLLLWLLTWLASSNFPWEGNTNYMSSYSVEERNANIHIL